VIIRDGTATPWRSSPARWSSPSSPPSAAYLSPLRTFGHNSRKLLEVIRLTDDGVVVGLSACAVGLDPLVQTDRVVDDAAGIG
jgi:hypothetical protein